MAKLTLVQAVTDALRTEMRLDDSIVLLGEDVGRSGGVFRATDGLYEEFGPERVFDTPLSEAGIVGSAIGMAVYGLKPVAEIQFEGFLPPAFDHIVNHMGRIRNRSRGSYTLPMVVRSPWGGGVHAPEQHSDSPEAWFVHATGLKVVIPSTPYDCKGLLIAALRDPDPVIFFEPKRIYRAFREEVPAEAYTVPIGQARIARAGDDLTIITWGAMVHTCLEAADQLAAQGVGAEVIDLRTLKPMDTATVVQSVQKTGRALVAHEAPKTCGVGAEVVAMINERAFFSLYAPVLRVAGFDVPMPFPHMERLYLPGPDRVVRGALQVMHA